MGLLRKIRRKLRKRSEPQYARPRRDTLLSHIDVATQRGLEIGPLCNPLVTKAESNGNVRYVDHATAEQLRAHYRNDPNVRLDAIVETDIVWGQRKLPELAGNTQFDYVIASHVIEHVPNMIGWLREIATVLRDGGVLSLAIPDKRYTFDFKRELTVLGTLVEYFLQDRRRPSTRDVFDHKSLVSSVDVVQAWNGTLNPEQLVLLESFDAAWEGAQRNETTDEYMDVHVTVVTPQSFLQLLDGINRLGLLDFSIVDFVDTQRNTLEFFVALSRTPRSLSSEEKMRRQAQSIAAALAKVSAPSGRQAAVARR
jgi:SAM-dependent methyltransferase